MTATKRRGVKGRVRQVARHKPLRALHARGPSTDAESEDQPGELQGLAVRRAEEDRTDDDAENHGGASRHPRSSFGEGAQDDSAKEPLFKDGAISVVMMRNDHEARAVDAALKR